LRPDDRQPTDELLLVRTHRPGLSVGATLCGAAVNARGSTESRPTNRLARKQFHYDLGQHQFVIELAGDQAQIRFQAGLQADD
jgi:hypothetical protein